MSRHLGPGAVPTTAMLNDMLHLLFEFRLTIPPEFTTFFRALVTLEGTLTTLSPGYLVIDAVQELASEWVRDKLTPRTLEELARKEMSALVPLVRRLPRHLDRIATIVERGDLATRVSVLSNEEDERVATRLVNRFVLALLGGMVGLFSVMLLGTSGGPHFTGDTSLFQLFGYFGLFCSTVLILRVIVAVMRDGLS